MKKQTQAIHLEYERRDAYDSLSVPVYNTLAYEFDNAAVMAEAFTDKIKAPDYSRVENPTVTNLERRVAALTDAAHATAFNSGMAAISNTLMALAAQGKNAAKRANCNRNIRLSRILFVISHQNQNMDIYE